MFGRTVPLVLIAAIIACPMWCGDGSRSCCAAEQALHLACPAQETSSCCHGDSSPDGNDDCPADAPRKSVCQGVCGGAVIENPCTIDGPEDSLFLPLIDTGVSLSFRLAQFRSLGVEDDTRCVGNQGRVLRTLHMSFLC